MFNLPPAMIFMVGGALMALLPRKGVLALVRGVPVMALYAIWHVTGPVDVTWAGFTLELLASHPFTRLFSTVFAIAALGGGVFGWKFAEKKELVAAYLYAGSAIGVTYAGDFITLFLYWEIMAVASTLIVLCGNTPQALKAALRYAAMHGLGGVMLMTGITFHIHETGSIQLVPLGQEGLALWLILAGVLVNAAAPPFSAWLADSYPEASPTGAVFLSAFTTKTAVFVLLTLFAGNSLLIPIGLFMVFYGIVYAMLENDARRILAYSIVNQVGFMVTGAGIGTKLALYGAATHAFCHIIYKALLMMSAGSVLAMTGRRKCTELGGLYRSMKLTCVCGIIGAMAISAVPMTSGFVSKSMISAAAPQAWIGYALLAASAGVFLHAGIKFPWFVFFNRDSGLRPADPPFCMKLAMVAFSVLCILPGIFPEWLYALLPSLPDYTPNTPTHIITQMQLLLFSALAFFALLPMLKRTDTLSLDFDWIYRVPLRSIALLGEHTLQFLGRITARQAGISIRRMVHINGPHSLLARNWPIGVTVMWVILLLGVALVVS